MKCLHVFAVCSFALSAGCMSAQERQSRFVNQCATPAPLPSLDAEFDYVRHFVLPLVHTCDQVVTLTRGETSPWMMLSDPPQTESSWILSGCKTWLPIELRCVHGDRGTICQAMEGPFVVRAIPTFKVLEEFAATVRAAKPIRCPRGACGNCADPEMSVRLIPPNRTAEHRTFEVEKCGRTYRSEPHCTGTGHDVRCTATLSEVDPMARTTASGG